MYKGGFMDIRQLETFINVCDLKSFSKAGDKLFITQPTVTNHIKNLEYELGVNLINRLGNTISVTDAGSILYKYAKDVIDSIDYAKHSLQVYEGTIEGNLNIETSSIPLRYYLPKRIARFLESHDNVTFNISSSDSISVINHLKNGRSDFGIVGFKTDDTSIEFKKIFSDEIFYIVSKDKLPDYKSFDYIETSVIKNIPLILRDSKSGTLRTVVNQIASADPDFFKREFSVSDDNDSIIQIVRSGYGGSFVSGLLIENCKDLLMLRLKDIPLNRDFFLIYNKLKNLSPLASAFESYLLD